MLLAAGDAENLDINPKSFAEMNQKLKDEKAAKKLEKPKNKREAAESKREAAESKREAAKKPEKKQKIDGEAKGDEGDEETEGRGRRHRGEAS